MNFFWLCIGLFLGFVIGTLGKAVAKKEDTLMDTWHKLLEEAGERLDAGKVLVLSATVTKEEVEKGPLIAIDQNWKEN